MPSLNDNLYQLHTDSAEKKPENDDHEKLNPEEWDPW